MRDTHQPLSPTLLLHCLCSSEDKCQKDIKIPAQTNYTDTTGTNLAAPSAEDAYEDMDFNITWLETFLIQLVKCCVGIQTKLLHSE